MNDLQKDWNDILYKFSRYVVHHEKTGLGGENNQTKTIDALALKLLEHTQTFESVTHLNFDGSRMETEAVPANIIKNLSTSKGGSDEKEI